MNLKAYIAKRMVYLVITLFAIIIFNFILFRVMPGDPAKVLVPKGNDPYIKEIIREKFNLNDPILEQLGHYIVQVFTLDFGISSGVWKYGNISQGLPTPIFNTVLLVGTGTIFASILGIRLGRFAAWRRGKPADSAGMAFALTFYSMPTFLFALVILMVFAGTLQWFPLKGAVPSNYNDLNLLGQIWGRIYHLILPVTAFTIEMMAEYALIMRNSLTDVLTEDYITTARAKGLSNKAVLNEHAMRNAMLPVVTVIAISVGWILGGDIMVEIVFSYDGLGLLTWNAVNKRDFPILQAVFLLMAIVVLICNLIADLIYLYLDPRVEV